MHKLNYTVNFISMKRVNWSYVNPESFVGWDFVRDHDWGRVHIAADPFHSQHTGRKSLGDEGERRERSLTQTRPTLKHLLRSVANVQNIKPHIDVTHTYGMWKTQQQDNNIIQRAIFKFLCNRRTDGTLKCTTFTAVTQCHVNTFMSYNELAST